MTIGMIHSLLGRLRPALTNILTIGWLLSEVGCDQYGDEFGYLTPEQLEQAYIQYEQEYGDPGSP